MDSVKQSQLAVGALVCAGIGFMLGYAVFGNGGEGGPIRVEVSVPSAAEPVAYKDMIRVSSPVPQEAVSSPLVVRGEARGGWFFEATFPVTVVNWDGLIIGEGYAEALSDWMVEDFVPFEARVAFDTSDAVHVYPRGAVILRKANASGLPEHDDAVEIPVVFER